MQKNHSKLMQPTSNESTTLIYYSCFFESLECFQQMKFFVFSDDLNGIE